MLLTPTIIRLGVLVARGPIPKRKDAAMLISFRKIIFTSNHFTNKPFTITTFEKSDNFSPICLAVQQLYFTSLI